MEKPMKLLIKSARQIVQVCDRNQRVMSGREMSQLAVLNSTPDSALSLAVNWEGRIEYLGSDEEVASKFNEDCFATVFDARDMVLLPGLVDSHTHPVWDGDRVEEFAMKLSGYSYMDIHNAGGGIHYTVEQTKKAPEDKLLGLLLERLNSMLQHGTTLAECKSGYGLDTSSEIKQLRVIERAKHRSSVEIHTTFCGAHAVPRGQTSEQATAYVVDDMIPAVYRGQQNKEFHVDSIDVFCEKGVFNVEESRRILSEGRKRGWLLNFHGEELNSLCSAEMGAAIGARAVSHLEHVTDEGIQAMSHAGTIAVILPTTAIELHLKLPPVRKMLKNGIAVALGTDFSPNVYCLSMPLVMHLASVVLKMTPSEVLVAATINAAASLGKADSHGSLEVGKQADIIVLRAPRWEHLIYQFSESARIISGIIKAGDIVKEDPKSK